LHKLKELRESHGLTLRKLGELAGVDYSNIRKIENGEIVPRIDTVLKLARALKVDIKELLDLEEAELVK